MQNDDLSIDYWLDFLKDLSLWAIAYPFEFDQVFSSINEKLKNEARHCIDKIMSKHYIEQINDSIVVNGTEFTVLDRNDCITFKNYYGEEIAVAIIRNAGASIMRCHFDGSILVFVLKNAPRVLDAAIKERDAAYVLN